MTILWTKYKNAHKDLIAVEHRRKRVWVVLPTDKTGNTKGELQLVEVRTIWDFFFLH